MDVTSNIALVACLLLATAAFFRLWIEWLNLRSVTSEIPAEFLGLYDAEKYKKSQEYLHDNTVLRLIETVFDSTALILFLLLSGVDWMDSIAQNWALRFMPQWGWGTVGVGLLFFGILSALSLLLSQPFSLYRTFHIEEKFGFNRTTLRTYFADTIKGILLSMIVGVPVAAVVLVVFEGFPHAWLWLWVGLTGFQIFLLFIAPVIIFPLFNKFSPLPDGELKAAIEALAREQNFKVSGLYTMDGSKRSTKGNAYFTGFGRFRRIVLFDTLISRLSQSELLAVLAHEIGHYKKRHVFKQLALSIASQFCLFYFFSLFVHLEIPIYKSMFYFAILYGPFSKLISLLSLYLSRRYEFEADAYSSATYREPDALAMGLKKLSVDTLSNLRPHWLKVWVDYTHPPVLDRVHALKK